MMHKVFSPLLSFTALEKMIMYMKSDWGSNSKSPFFTCFLQREITSSTLRLHHTSQTQESSPIS